MKKLFKPLLIGCLLTASLFYSSGCNNDDDPGPQLTGDSKTYDLNPVSDQGISGTVTFAERDDDQVLITIQLTGTQSGNTHPAHIHGSTAAEGGTILLDLTDVDGATGKSETVVKALNDGTALTYDDLLNFDGYVNVHASSANLGTLIAQGDIGQNELTGDSESYSLGPVSNPDISGTATFAKRVNGETLVTVQLDGTTDGAVHPSHIHANTAAQGGGIVINLTDIDGTTGLSRTNIGQMNDGTPITYDDLINFNGYLNVHLAEGNLGTLVAQGDIGQNELTGTSKVYDLNPKTNPDISGTVTFAERASGATLITIQLDGTTEGGLHPAHIHANNAATGGPIVLDFNDVNGATGTSRTNVTALNDDSPITYTQLIAFNGYVNVHLSDAALGTLIAQGDIGSNAP
jgi:Holliday junction resolvase